MEIPELPLGDISITSGMPLVVVYHFRSPLRVVLVPHEQPCVARVIGDVLLDPFLGIIDVLLDPLSVQGSRVLDSTTGDALSIERHPPGCQIGQRYALHMPPQLCVKVESRGAMSVGAHVAAGSSNEELSSALRAELTQGYFIRRSCSHCGLAVELVPPLFQASEEVGNIAHAQCSQLLCQLPLVCCQALLHHTAVLCLLACQRLRSLALTSLSPRSHPRTRPRMYPHARARPHPHCGREADPTRARAGV